MVYDTMSPQLGRPAGASEGAMESASLPCKRKHETRHAPMRDIPAKTPYNGPLRITRYSPTGITALPAGPPSPR
jgi:hypothetical protein